MSPNKPKSWRDVKPVLENLPPKKLVSLIGELYRHSKANKNFIDTRFSSVSVDLSERIRPYKKIIKESLSLDMYSGSDIKIRPAQKAISDYAKSSKDEDGTIELMLYFLEVGTDVTCMFGDLWEGFYSSMMSMGDRIAEKLEEREDTTLTEQFQPRFERLVSLAGHFGWGYGDYLNELYDRLYGYTDSQQATEHNDGPRR